MLERGPAARFASSVFYENYNDIDIYVEDTAEGYNKLFAVLLNRTMSSNVSLERVFPLGTRGKVIEAAKRNLIEKEKRKSVFIVDGDLFLLSGEETELPSNIIRLPRYCIENFLIDKTAFHELLDEECVDKSRIQLEQFFNYEKWKEKALEPLKQLFRIFAINHKLKAGIKCVGLGSSSVCINSMGDISIEKANDVAKQIDISLRERFGDAMVNSTAFFIDEQINNSCCFVTTYVSGKDFLLPLLLARFRTISKSKIPNINLKHRLARKCDTSSLSQVVTEIGKIIGRDDILNKQAP